MSTLKFGTILKRSHCMNSVVSENSTQLEHSEKLYSNINKMIDERVKTGKEDFIKNSVSSFLESLCNKTSASNMWSAPLDLLEKFNDLNEGISAKILYEYTNRILPYTEDLDIVNGNLEYLDITKEQKKVIGEAVDNLLLADRIINNHKQISNRYHIEAEISRYNSLGIKYVVETVADKITTYNIPDYQKLNMTIEETAYMMESKGYDYDKSDLAKYALEYFLINNQYISDKDHQYFGRVLECNCFLDKEDLSKVDYIYGSREPDCNSITRMINSFLVAQEKNPELLKNNIIVTLKGVDKNDLFTNIDKLMYFLWDMYKADEDDDSTQYSEYVELIVSCINNFTKENDISMAEICVVMDKLKAVYESIYKIGNMNVTLTTKATKFAPLVNNLITNLRDVYNHIYNDANISAINKVNSCTEKVESLNEFKVFKFHNLVRAAFNLDKFLGTKEKKIYQTVSPKFKKAVKKVKNTLFGESVSSLQENVYSYIGTDNRADICVRQYIISESHNNSEVDKFLSSVCNEFNDFLLSEANDTSRAYYIINPGIAEVRIKEGTKVELTEEEKTLCESSFDNSIDTYLEMLVVSEAALDQLKEFTNVEDYIKDFSIYEGFTLEHFETAIDCLSLMGVDESVVKLFGSKFSEYQFNNAIENGVISESYLSLASQERKIDSLIENWTVTGDVPLLEQLEAFSYFDSLMSSCLKEASMADDWDDEDDEDEDEKDKKKESSKSEEKEDKKEEKLKDPRDNPGAKDVENYKPKKSRSRISLNSIKLGLHGLRTKLKDMNTKQKQISANLDNAVRSTVKAMKDSLTQDRREQIIKGSLIPSFSRCIKNGILLAGLGIATGSVVVPIIAAIGGLAISKKLNDKERLLLLDEIETELEVVEKELQIADSNNQMKKYRALLQYKKDLQRQYQRIRYNIRVGKDILPNSSTGVKKPE